MPVKIKRITFLVALFTAILLLVAIPGVTSASTAMTTDIVPLGSCQPGTNLCERCLVSDCSLFHCAMDNINTGEIILENRLFTSEKLYLSLSLINLSIGTTLDKGNPDNGEYFLYTATQELPAFTDSWYRCRDSLNSEDPLQR